mmetsp:Transcript_15118/g.35411  ORF Transcript_15118/g.35411 Transcript_15118/m.35411 type:complete len:233 (-) Transcript_15118:80-778(-)
MTEEAPDKPCLAACELGAVADSASSLPLEAFPPLPEPDPRKCSQSAVGSGVVLVLTTLCIGVVFFVTLDGPLHEKLICRGLVLSEALVALVCLAGLLWGDPGVIGRSPGTSFPLPEQLVGALRKGETIECNVQDGDRTFCVRCFVWRDRGAHHCRVCQRCVADFDHHCDVFGRCIAGGNMNFFYGVTGTGIAGLVTVVGSMVYGAVFKFWLAEYALICGVVLACCIWCWLEG